MDIGDLMISTTTLASGIALLGWAFLKFYYWRESGGDLAVAIIVAAVGATLTVAGGAETYAQFNSTSPAAIDTKIGTITTP